MSAGSNRWLARKVWRDAVALGSTSIALMVLVAVGACLFVIFSETRANLEASYQNFYRDHGFADATILVDLAPESLVISARQIPGVQDAIGRAVKDGTIILRDRARRRVQGRFVGVDPRGVTDINTLLLLRGRPLSSRSDCLVEHQFARLNEVRIGDRLSASYLGRRRDFRVVGMVASPEYIYPAPSKEAPWASPQAFGVVWIDEDAARQWFGIGRQVTEVNVRCRPGTALGALEILKGLGERYGLRSWWDQREQPSNHLLSMDLQGFQALSVMFPVLFMFAAALSLYSSLTRIGRLQTGVVGFLRASGFSARQVMWHYLLQGGLIAGAGAAPGLFIGHWLAVLMTAKYVSVLHLPNAVNRAHPDVLLAAFSLSMVTGLVSAWLPARAAAAIPPAVAMRGDRDDEDMTRRMRWLLSLTSRLPVLWRIPLRGLARRPSRTLFAVGGLVSGTSLLLSTVGMYASITSTIDGFMNKTLRYELDVAFISRAGEPLLQAVAETAGVDGVYRTCQLIARFRGRKGSRNLTLMGIQPGQRSLGVQTLDGRPCRPAPGEVWLPQKLAGAIGVEPGDAVQVEWAFSSRQRFVKQRMRVAGLLDPSLGGMAYGNVDDLERSFLDRTWPDGGRGAQIICDPEVGKSLRRQLERDDLVAACISIQDIRDEVETSLRVTLIFCTVLLAFGMALAGAVLHSVSSVGILERLRELATLRSLGFSAQATALTAAVEIYTMALFGLLFGLPAGTWLNRAYLSLYETETMSFEPVLPLWGYLLVTAIVLGLVAFSLRGGLRRLQSMDLAQATKARE